MGRRAVTRTRILIAVAAALCLLLTASRARAQSPGAGKDEKPAVKPATADAGYIIGEDDVLNISVWKEPEITKIVPVRPDGKISLPLIKIGRASCRERV